MSEDDGEFSAGGSAMLRHQAREREWSLADSPEGWNEAIEAHFDRTVGKAEMVFHEIVSDLVHLDVHYVPATAERPFVVLYTTGMSSLPMTMPKDAPTSPYAELVVLLPPDWKLPFAGVKEASEERWYWPVRWLKNLARLPHEYRTWIGPGHTVPNGNPPVPFDRSTGFAGMLVATAISLSDESQFVTMPDGRVVELWTLYPLHANEIDLKLQKGVDTLFERMEAAGVSDVIDAARPSCVGPPPRKKLFGLF